MTDSKYFGNKVYVTEYIKFLQREIENLKSETIGHEDAYFTEMPVIKVNKITDDFEGEAILNWEDNNE